MRLHKNLHARLNDVYIRVEISAFCINNLCNIRYSRVQKDPDVSQSSYKGCVDVFGRDDVYIVLNTCKSCR